MDPINLTVKRMGRRFLLSQRRERVCVEAVPGTKRCCGCVSFSTELLAIDILGVDEVRHKFSPLPCPASSG